MTPALTGMPVLTTGTAVVVAAAAAAAAVGVGATEQALSCAGGLECFCGVFEGV